MVQDFLHQQYDNSIDVRVGLLQIGTAALVWPLLGFNVLSGKERPKESGLRKLCRSRKLCNLRHPHSDAQCGCASFRATPAPNMQTLHDSFEPTYRRIAPKRGPFLRRKGGTLRNSHTNKEVWIMRIRLRGILYVHCYIKMRREW